MNVTTAHGSYAATAVTNPSRPGVLAICTRDQAAAEHLAAWYEDWRNELANLTGPGETLNDTLIPSSHVVHAPQVPAWFIHIPTTAWAAWLAETAEDIDYPAFPPSSVDDDAWAAEQARYRQEMDR